MNKKEKQLINYLLSKINDNLIYDKDNDEFIDDNNSLVINLAAEEKKTLESFLKKLN